MELVARVGNALDLWEDKTKVGVAAFTTWLSKPLTLNMTMTSKEKASIFVTRVQRRRQIGVLTKSIRR